MQLVVTQYNSKLPKNLSRGAATEQEHDYKKEAD